MSVPSVPAESSAAPAQVWAPSTTDLQTRAIQLMAQLAFHRVAAQAGWRPGKEFDDAVSVDHSQDPA